MKIGQNKLGMLALVYAYSCKRCSHIKGHSKSAIIYIVSIQSLTRALYVILFFLCNIYNIKHITIDPIKSACFIYRRQGNYFGKILAKQQKHFVFRQVLESDGITVTTMVSDSDMTFCTHANENIWIPLIDDIRSERHSPCSCAIEFFSTDVIIILSSERRYENPRDTSFSLFIINLLS